MADHKGFFLYLDQYQPISRMSLEQKGALLEAMFAYNAGEEVIFSDPLVEMAFGFFRQTFERDKQRYEDKCAKMRENAAKRQKQPDDTNCDQKQPIASRSTQQQEQKQEQDKNKRQENTPQPPQGELPTVPSSFDRFWAAYPNKVGKDAARKAWEKAKGKPKIDDLLAILDRQKTWPKWRNDNGRYIPNPSTWLNQGRWNDEPPQVAQGSGHGNYPDTEQAAAAERVRARREMLKAAERGEVA